MEKQKNIPVLRFSEFEQEWEKKHLEDVIHKMQSGVSRRLSDTDIGYPILRSNNIQNGRLDVSEIKYWHLIDDQGVNLKNYLLNSGDILVNFINSLAQIGKAAMYENLLNRDTIYTTNILRLILKNGINPRFIFCNFNTKKYHDYIQSITKPAVNQASFTTKEFQNFSIGIPTLTEQQKIASFFTAIDQKITQLKNKKDLLEEYKNGVMQKIFSQEIRFRDENGKEFPKWEKKELGEIGEFKNGINKGKEDFGFGFPFINLMNVFGKPTISCLNLDLVNATKKELELYKLEKGDVLFIRSSVKRTGVGETSLVMEDLKNTVFSGFLIRFRDNKIRLSLNFKKYCFSTTTFRKDLISLSTTSANTNINQESLVELLIRIPCIEEQIKIADFLSAIDDKINHTQIQIEKAEVWKKGLLQQMFV